MSEKILQDEKELTQQINGIKGMTLEGSDTWYTCNDILSFLEWQDNQINCLRELVNQAAPCMEYIHSRLPEGSEALKKYEKWITNVKLLK